MAKETAQKSSSPEEAKNKCYIIHCKVIGGSPADIYDIGSALKEFKKTLPFRLEVIVTNDKVELQDVDTLIREFLKLKKILKDGEQFEHKEMSNM